MQILEPRCLCLIGKVCRLEIRELRTKCCEPLGGSAPKPKHWIYSEMAIIFKRAAISILFLQIETNDKSQTYV